MRKNTVAIKHSKKHASKKKAYQGKNSCFYCVFEQRYKVSEPFDNEGFEASIPRFVVEEVQELFGDNPVTEREVLEAASSGDPKYSLLRFFLFFLTEADKEIRGFCEYDGMFDEVCPIVYSKGMSFCVF